MQLGIESIVCNNGEEAINKCILHRHELGIIIMDIDISIMDGYSTATNLKRVLMEKTVPIVGVTCQANDITRRKCLDSGISSIVFIPWSFFSKIQQVISQFMK